MAAITPSSQTVRKVTGNLVHRFYTLPAYSDSDTLTIPGGEVIQFVSVTPTTAVAVGATWSGQVITFRGACASVVDVVTAQG
jgi:hypothetical protein